MQCDSPYQRPRTQWGGKGPGERTAGERTADEMARTALEMPEIFLASRTKNSAEVASVLQLGRIGERLDATLSSLRLYWTRHGNAAVRTWEEVIRTTEADLLSAIPLMAHALRSSDPDLQLLYCSLLECQRDMQRTSDAVQAHVQLNISIAREVSGHPGCQDLVKDKVLLAWCEGMLAERARTIAKSCGLRHFPPFIQALHCLAADPCLPLPPLTSPNTSALTAPPQLHTTQHSSSTLTAQQRAVSLPTAAQTLASLAGTGGAITEFTPHNSSKAAAIGHGRVSDPAELAIARGGVHQGQNLPEPGRIHARPQPTPRHPLAALFVSPCSRALLHQRGQPVPPQGLGFSPVQAEQSLVPGCPLPAISLVQHSRQFVSERRPEREGHLLGAASIGAVQPQGIVAGASGLRLNSRVAPLGPHEAHGAKQRPEVAIGEPVLRGQDTSHAMPATVAMSAGQQLGAHFVQHHGARSMQPMPIGAHDVTLPREADSATPASTAGVLQSGSSEELATALAGLTQMVSSARGMPRPSHIEESCGGALNVELRDERLSAGLCTADTRPCIEHPMTGSQAAEPVRNKDQDVAGSAQVDKGSPQLRPPKRAGLVAPAELLHDPPELTRVNLPGGHISEPAQPVAGLRPCENARSFGPYISQLQLQPVGASAAPEPTGSESGPGNPADGVHSVRAVVAAEGQSAASLRLQVIEHTGGRLELDEQQNVADAAGQPAYVDAEGSLSAGPNSTYSEDVRAILRGDAAPSTSTDKSSPHSHQRSVHGAQVSCPDPSPTKESAQHRASFAFVQPEGARVGGTLEQLTPALPVRAVCSAAPEAQPIARRGASGDVVPDSEEHTTPPDQDDRGSQPRGSAHALECSAQPSLKMATVGKADGGDPGGSKPEQQGEGADAGYCRAALIGAADQAMSHSPLSTPHSTQLGASGGPGSCPGSAERECLLAQAAGMPAAAATALLESQRGSNSPKKRKLPQPHRPLDCGTSSGSPASQAPSSHMRGSSGKDLTCLAAASSQRGASSQPSPLCPTRLGQHRLADASSQPDASPAGIPALHMPQSQAACNGPPAATGMATCGSQPCAEAAEGPERMDAARVKTAVRLKWLRAVRVLQRMACRWQVLPAQRTWSSDVRVPISRDSSADASHHWPSNAAHNSGSKSQGASPPHEPMGHAVVTPVGLCAGGEAAANTVPGKNHSDCLASSDWRTARSHGSGRESHAGEQSIQGRCCGGPAQISEKRQREAPMEGEESQIAEHACSQDDSAGQLAADSSHQKKRPRTEGRWSAGGSQRAAPLEQGVLMRQILGTQPAGARDAQEEVRAKIGGAQIAHVHACAPAAMEADSDVDIGGPDDFDHSSGSRSNAPGDQPLTHFPPQNGSIQGGGPSQAAGTQAGLMHSSEEQDPPCGQPLPPPHLSLGDRVEDYGRTPAALLLRAPLEQSPWATPHFSHPHTAERSHPDAPCSQRPAANDPVAGPSAAGASGQNATMRVLSLEGRPSPGWTPGLMCSGTGAPTEMPQRSDAGGTVPEALHRLARGAPFMDPMGGLSLQKGSCQPPLMTQSERPDPSEAGPRQQMEGPRLQGLQALEELQHYEACQSLDGLLYGASQNSDHSLPLSQPARPLP